jgi:hypothetical protein
MLDMYETSLLHFLYAFRYVVLVHSFIYKCVCSHKCTASHKNWFGFIKEVVTVYWSVTILNSNFLHGS